MQTRQLWPFNGVGATKSNRIVVRAATIRANRTESGWNGVCQRVTGRELGGDRARRAG